MLTNVCSLLLVLVVVVVEMSAVMEECLKTAAVALAAPAEASLLKPRTHQNRVSTKKRVPPLLVIKLRRFVLSE